MSVTPNQLKIYGSVNMTETDSVTVGGAVDLTRMVSFSDMITNGLLDFVSSSASDTTTRVQVAGLDAAGLPLTPAAVQLTGLTKVAGTSTFNRLLYGVTSGASATGPLAAPGVGSAPVGDVAVMAHTLTWSARTAQTGAANATGILPPKMVLQSGDGSTVALGMIVRITGGTGIGQLRRVESTAGTGQGQYGVDTIAVNRDWSPLIDSTSTYEIATGMLFEILPNPVTSIVRPLSGISADGIGGAARVYVEKCFVLNTNTTTGTTNLILSKFTDPAGLYSSSSIQLDIAPCNALNDTGTVANRQTAPVTGMGAFSSGAAPQVISLSAQTAAANAASQAQGFWIKATVAAGAAPINSSWQVRPSATTA